MDSSLQDLQLIFEYELKRKLSERAKTSSGEMRVLLNGFKFFDINYTGIITKSQWIQGILRTGLTGFSENDLDSLFTLYDKNNTEKIDYKNFCSFIYGREPLNPLTDNSQSLQIDQNNINENDNYKTNYEKNNQEIDMNVNVNNQNNFSNTPNNQRRNYNNRNNYNDNIIGETPFNNNNQYNNNIINNQRRQISSPNNYFNNNQNDNFGYNMRTPINKDEYQENTNFRKSQRKINSYNSTYNDIFQQESNQTTSTNSNNCNISENAINSIIMSIRNNININNGIKLFMFIKRLKIKESNNLQISINDLYNIFQEMRINIPYDELKIIFNYANKNDSDIISTDQLISIIKGNLDEQRKLYIDEIFSNIDSEQTKKISIELLKNTFNAKRHPEVINGTKSQEEILEQFCYSLDLYCDINSIPKNGELSYENFVDYYSCISASIPDEVYFEDMINGVWSDIKIKTNNQNQNINYNNNNNNINANNMVKNINNNNKYNTYESNKYNYNINSILMGISSNERINNFQKNELNSKNNYNNNKFNDNNNQPNYNVERKIKNSMSSPYIYDNNANNKNIQSNNNNNYRNSNNNNDQSPFIDYSKNRRAYNKVQNPPRGMDNYQNKNKIRYNPILDEYYPETKNSNDCNYNNNINSNNHPKIIYQRNPTENSNYINTIPNVTTDINNTKAKNSNQINNLRNILISRGHKTIFTFQRMLTKYDRSNSGVISLEDFENIFQVYSFNFSDSDIQNIFNLYQQNKPGSINYSPLIDDLVGQMNEKRISVVQKVFNNFNKNENGEVSLKEIKQRFNPRGHPDALNRKKDHNEVFGEFLDILEIYREYIYNIKGRIITNFNLDDFKQFYAEISMSIKDDTAFENMMIYCWNMKNDDSGLNMGNNNNYNNNYGYDRNIRARTGQQIMNMNNRRF